MMKWTYQNPNPNHALIFSFVLSLLEKAENIKEN